MLKIWTFGIACIIFAGLGTPVAQADNVIVGVNS
jgi:hypothetical protein